MENIEHYINTLKSLVEETTNQRMVRTNDFEFLRSSIYSLIHENIGVNTLKRVWGMNDEHSTPHMSTLDILSRYVGFRNWDAFVKYCEKECDASASHMVLPNYVVARKLAVGAKMRITWCPGRVCELEYLGDENFKVLGSKRSKLMEGDTFHTSIFIQGEPLLVDNLIQEDKEPNLYVAGKNGGLTQIELL